MGPGSDLFELVEEYADLGDHRTGTDVDEATLDWLGGKLGGLGLESRLERFEFEQWTASSRLTANGVPVPHLPVFYEFTGRVETDEPALIQLDPLFGGFPSVLDDPISEARASGAPALVVATSHPEGSLVAINRVPGAGSGYPTVLVGSREFERLAGADLELRFEASLTTGQSATLVADREPTARPIIVTTPLTGWFRCAGERGTGIAVLLDVVQRCADRPIMVVATTGHELDYLGARRWAEQSDVEPAAIVHLGASIAVDEAVDDGSRRLAATRQAMTNIGEADAAPVGTALADAALTLTPSAQNWIGEGAVFAELGVPLLSMSGAGIDFHTPEDLPHRVTSPQSLRIASDAVVTAVGHFLESIQQNR